ncbi:MAG: ribosome assembly cofactor RimP [Salinivirgaceae bacterium]|nr:MAG: ribosome assembly cofactor RimP [Salinivirgaceae bacterium]
MLSKEKIEATIQEAITDTETFLVEVKMTADNKIFVYADAPNGMPIDECVRISKYIEAAHDRDEEDYELQVSSPGIDQPFRVIEQYKKHIDKDVRVILKDGATFDGVITEVGDDEVTLKWEEKIKVPGQKKKEIKEEIEKIKINDIASAKAIITF